MPDSRLSRRVSLLLPFLLAACGGGERVDYPTLRYTYLPPIRLNVANIVIEQRYQPSGVAPDITQLDPAPPADALRAMAEDRLKAYGVSGRAVFIIQDASLTRQGDVITGTMRVRLEIYNAENVLAGFAAAATSAQHTGHVSDLRETLYNLTRSMMENMNVEFELQVNNNLRDWLVSNTAPLPPQVQQAPLDGGQPPPLQGGPVQGGSIQGGPAPGAAPPPSSLPQTAPPPSGAPPGSVGAPPPPVPLNAPLPMGAPAPRSQ